MFKIEAVDLMKCIVYVACRFLYGKKCFEVIDEMQCELHVCMYVIRQIRNKQPLM